MTILLSSIVILSQFYLFSSGIPQISDYLLAGFFTILLLSRRTRALRLFWPLAPFLMLFLGYVLISNTLWALSVGTNDFLMSSLYFVFGSSILLFIPSWLLGLSPSKQKPVLHKLQFSFLLGLGLLALLAILQIGRSLDFRFHAFFNDPNQMAYWALCCASSFYLLEIYLKKNIRFNFRNFIPWSFLVPIIFSSASRSSFLPFATLTVIIAFEIFDVADLFRRIFSNLLRFKYNHIIIFLIMLFIGIQVPSTISFFIENESVAPVIARVTSTDVAEELDDRGYTRAGDNIHYLIFGMGQGAHQRFGTKLEIHSSWFGLVFYYGIPGTVLFGLFLYFLLTKLNSILLVSVALLLFFMGLQLMA